MIFASEAHIVAPDEASIEALPQSSAVFVIERRDAKPYPGRTTLLRRRLKRMLRIRGLREVIERIRYWPCASSLESSLVLYETSRHYLPDTYARFLKLRFPAWVKLITSNPFPRTQITTRPGAAGVFYGPFRSRAAAEMFERRMLELFQLRRCQEDLAPSPDHPGCIYGEMNMCLRPCQEVVGIGEYATEAARVAEFLRTGGKVALQTAQASRDRLSSEMDFEAAARQHRRVEQIEEVLRSRDDLAHDLESLNGIAVTAGHEPLSVLLWILIAGWWRAPISFSVTAGHSESMDQRLRQLIVGIAPERGSTLARQEHVTLLARWFYSSWRDGSWIGFESLARFPYRKVVSAISRTVHQNPPAASD